MIRAIGQHLSVVFSRNVFRLIFTVILLVSGLSVMSLLFLAQKNVGILSRTWTQQVQVIAYLVENPEPAAIAELESSLKQNPSVESFSSKTKEQNQTEFRQQFPELVQNQNDASILNNAMTSTYEVKLKDPKEVEKVTEFLNSQMVVENASFGSGVAENIFKLVDLFQNISMGSIVLFSFFGLVLVQLAIFMSVYSKKQEIEILSLLGTPNNLIRMPFAFEGAILCFASAGLGLILSHFLFIGITTWFNGQPIGSGLASHLQSFSYSEVISILLLASFMGFFLGLKSTQFLLKEKA